MICREQSCGCGLSGKSKHRSKRCSYQRPRYVLLGPERIGHPTTVSLALRIPKVKVAGNYIFVCTVVGQ